MRILFLGAPIAAIDDKTLSYQERFSRTGYNSGNILIGQSIFDELIFTEFGFGTSFAPEEVDDRFDMIVIAAANFIFKNFDFSYLADFIEKTNVPCVMVGLGAQAPRSSIDKVKDIPEGTVRLLKIVSDRSKTVGVRGYFTAEVMNDFGIKNVRAIGCPSIYRKKSRDLKIKRIDFCKNLKITLNGSRNVYEHADIPEDAKFMEGEILKLSISGGVSYVLQNEKPEMDILLGCNEIGEFYNDIGTIIKRFGLNVSEFDFYNHVKNNNNMFFNLNDWDNYISKFDISIGSRFHGNVIALTNGVPAIVLTHDSRTQEMADLASIPHLSVGDVREVNIIDIARHADFDEFENKYKILYDRFAEFLNENGLEHKLADAEKAVSAGGAIRLGV